MTVYVDQPIHKFGRMIMCHLIADSTEELLAMVDLIGVARQWIQKQGQPEEHFDIAKSKRALALANGAVEADRETIVAVIRRKRAVTQTTAR